MSSGGRDGWVIIIIIIYEEGDKKIMKAKEIEYTYNSIEHLFIIIISHSVTNYLTN